MENLHDLQISMTGVSDEGLKELTGLKELHTLDLRLTKVKDAGLKHLARLKNLQSLNLSHTAVTDAGLKELGGITNLQSLDLTVVEGPTDAGLKELAGLKNLRVLDLEYAKVTTTGIAELQKALPRLRINNGHPVNPAADKVPELPAELVAAWKKAGAVVGWMSDDQFTAGWFSSDRAGMKGEVPAFAFSTWTAVRRG